MSCKFSKQWLDKIEFQPWLRETDNPATAYCHVCQKTIVLSNMGQRALVSHMKGKKHEQALRLKSGETSQPSISSFIDKGPNTQRNVTECQPATDAPKTKTVPIQQYCPKDTRRAEILWALKTVKSHHSYNSNADIGDIFRAMFPDSEIAKNFKVSPTKFAYLVCFGIAPYFRERLIDMVRMAPGYVVSFDESLNSVCQEGQMDVLVRYFSRNKIISRYLDSQFLGHSTAKDLLTAFKQGTNKLNPSKILQISMDGPNVNQKFLKDFVEDRKKTDPDLPGVLQLGSCSLHVLHGAFATGIQKTGWNLEKLLRAIYYLFEDSPARRENYKGITKSEVFGLQFCSTRWVEDVSVAERAIEIWPNLVMYIKETLKKTKKDIPTVASFTTVQDFVLKDPLVIAKLETFISAAKLVQPFLKVYQTDKPMMPFITGDLCNLLRSLLGRYMKDSVLNEVKTAYKLAAVAADDSNTFLPIDKVDPGFAAKRELDEALKSKAISPLQKKEFLDSCQKLYSSMAQKILDRCPLKYGIVRGLQALDPRYMVSHQHSAEEKMRSVLHKLVDENWKPSRVCDVIMQQYKELLELLKVHFQTQCENFSPVSDRLDTFMHTVIGLGENTDLKELWELMQSLLTLSHGQAAVERGFSVNSDLLTPNLKKHSLVAQRIVYDTISVSGIPVAEFQVTPELLQSCAHAYTRYSTYLDDLKKETENKEKKRKRDSVEGDLRNAQKKLKMLEGTAKSLMDEADKQALQAEHKNNFTLLAKSNALRQKAQDVDKDIQKQRKLVDQLNASLKKV